MKACLHKKFGSIVVTTFGGEQFNWCRNCGSLVGPGMQVTPQAELEREKPKKKVREAPKWDLADDPF